MPSSPNDPNLNLDTLIDLVKLLQKVSEREEAINQCAEHWHQACLDLKQACVHVAFKYKYMYLCLDFEQHKNETKAGHTICLKSVPLWTKTQKSLELKLEKANQELNYWRECYETLLGEHLEHDGRRHDGPHQKF